MTLAGSVWLFRVCNMVRFFLLTGDVSTCSPIAAGCLLSASFDAVVFACTGGLWSFFVKIAANVVSAVVLSYLIVAEGTSGWGRFKVSVVY